VNSVLHLNMQRNAAGIDSKERDYVMKQHGPPESRQEKRYMDISVVPFTRPATSIFRDNLEKRKSQSFPDYKFEEKIDEKEPDRRGAHIINLELGNRNTPLQSKAISSVDQNKNRVFSSSKVFAIFGMSLGMLLMAISISNQDLVALPVPSASDPAATVDSGPSMVPSWLLSELSSVKER